MMTAAHPSGDYLLVAIDLAKRVMMFLFDGLQAGLKLSRWLTSRRTFSD